MEIVIYLIITYFVGMFLSSVIVKFIDPYGTYMEDSLFTVLWPIAFPFWCIFRIATSINNLASNMLL